MVARKPGGGRDSGDEISDERRVMHLELLEDLAIVLVAAGAAALAFRWLRQPLLLGYIVAGMLIGPYLLPAPLVQDLEVVHTLAEIGVMMLMFSHGLHFNFRRLIQVGVTGTVAAVIQIGVMVGLGIALARFFGWDGMDGVFLGVLLSISSTTIVYKVLIELGQVKEKYAAISFGVLMIEDTLAIAMLALVSSIALTGAFQADAILGTVGRLGIFLVLTPVAGLVLVPRLLAWAGRFKNFEVLLLTALALCCGVTLFTLQLGYSVALGAFIIGALVSESRESARINELIEPVRNMFSAVFFVAVGMLLDPRMLVAYAWPIATITGVVILAKLVSYSLATALCGHSPRTSLKVGLTLAQIGEFSFIIASVGLTLGVTSDFLYPITVAVSLMTTLATPYFIRYSDELAEFIWRNTPKSLARSVAVYTRLGPPSGFKPADPMMRRLLRRWMLQVGFNLTLIAAMFLVAYEAGKHVPWLPFDVPDWIGGETALLWFGAVMAVLPVFVATFRKVQAICMFAAEAAMQANPGQRPNYQLRMLISNLMLVFCTGLLAVFVIALSGALLPPLPVLAIIVLFVVIVMRSLWNHFIRVYARAQSALEETLAQAPTEHEPPPEALVPLLEEIGMALVDVRAGTWCAGKQIREVALRTRTGASVVAIARGTERIINPDPFEELRDGDGLLMIGSEQQLARGRELLALKSPPPGAVETVQF